MKTATPEIITFTYSDFLNLPDDGRRYEIIDGELFMTPAPATKHQTIAVNLTGIFYNFINRTQAGRIFSAPYDVVLSETDVVEPDLMFVSKERTKIITEKNIQGPPDLVVEILSPHTGKLDRTVKKDLYEKYRVKEYWIIDPENETVEVWSLKGNSYKQHARFDKNNNLKSPLLTDLQIDLKQLFAK